MKWDAIGLSLAVFHMKNSYFDDSTGFMLQKDLWSNDYITLMAGVGAADGYRYRQFTSFGDDKVGLAYAGMEYHPDFLKFEHFRWLGDKRTQVVYDLDAVTDASVIDELIASEQYAAFGPDTLAEARNRSYRARSA